MSSLLLFLLPVLILGRASTLDFRYHDNRQIEQYLVQIRDSNPDITHLYSIGQSVRGQQLWALALSLTPQRHTVGIPEFKYVANMHGNEVLGRVLLLQLIDDLVRGYRNNETWSLQLLKSTRIHILPTMNPDGFNAANTDCVYSQGRFNYNGVDLNRNFPDAFAGLRRQEQLEEEKREAEVRAVIGWLRTESFVLSANLHGGALVASYPYDNSNRDGELVGGASVTPDNDVFVHLSKVYSHSHASMHRGNICGDTRPFLDGVTNGFQWYPLQGGMQDYNYVWAQCLELTLEVSCCKFPPENQLPVLWTENRKSLLAFIQQVHLGVKGRVFNGSGVPVQNAVVEVEGRRNMCPFRTDRHGEYYRLLLPGNYSFTVTYPGHEVLTETLNVPHGPDQYSALKHDFMLRQIPTTTGRTSSYPTSASLTPTCNYTLKLEGGGAIFRPTWTGLSAGLGLVTALRYLID
ncbi:carboxypeptidase M [Anoplopoma fimbria]|uniref:carboxypeptidase M n=1 Tax=Anoplopoma fimbria TaxID=229290 RepID=UPI0023ED25AA|nr:carboxypeptidase M [Anoplopoma fimbria]XP_054480554.1 carboxypeptidase M [Anoplopoma fimbria]XP_054480555.1 carboxypeptidase M [Anoplopoma fimbria]XP_054480556.1 carboxypeptidase M [Anoplopoma fimbria]XP_054480558.1 carboxypeptidase M [Anoplopoma fimbria]